MICPSSPCDLNDIYRIVKIIKKYKNGRYIISNPKINYINDYLEEYDFTNEKHINITLHRLLNTVVYLPDDFNVIVKFKLPILVKHLGINTDYDFTNKIPKMIIGINNYIDFEKINNDMFLLNLKLYTYKYFKLVDYINKYYDVNTTINYKYKIRNIMKNLNKLQYELWKYLREHFSNIFFDMSIDYKFCHVLANL